MGQFRLVCACGGGGAVARFVLNTSIQRSWGKLFTLSTFIIKVLAFAKGKKFVMAAFYVVVTLVIPFSMVIVGWWVGSMGR